MKQALVNGFQMAYRDEGNGLPVLLVHAFPLTGLMWNPQVEGLHRNFRLIIPDLRGFGESAAGAPVDRYSSMEQYADDLAALLPALGLEKVVLMGLSMGGYIAFAFYRKYAEKVLGLVLCDTRSEADTPEGRQNRYNLVEKVRQQGSLAAAEAMVPRLFAPDTYRVRPDLVAQVAGLIERNNPAGIIAAAGAMAERPDATPILARIKVPTLVMVGKDDQFMPVEGARKMAQAIPDWQLSVVPHAGHLSNLENAEFFNQAVETFLKGLK